MKVWIMRHGDAPYIDGERQLSESGKQDVAQMSQRLADILKQQELELELMLASPYLRAQQTADIVEQELMNAKVRPFLREQEPLLRSESDPAMTASYVEALPQSTILLVSHMPLVANLLASWLPHQGRYFPTSAIAEIDFEGDKPNLSSFYEPQ
ncbi:phosphohistidine phosphatase SixA [Kangiella profundi]|uniref:Phosphohistidine phosphatase SixA n=1 Tax=Kangiella profundi TaxID=1561924 RepID=A0A2K9B2M3_9GAMM|nr:phosphohistidine phosphatase SixA [Kangiella profundi]AUD79168.1 phosphohistidine phosphatase SixA [Kangiella profundi]MBD3669034.1 phosphohistidine phosphatase SixA [Kangiella sp.]GGF00922.1 phosphohistidine phosphatase [Kangiella profundi]